MLCLHCEAVGARDRDQFSRCELTQDKKNAVRIIGDLDLQASDVA